MMEFIDALWRTIAALAPSLLLGLLLAGLLHVFVKKERILSHLGKPGFKSSAKAALVGVPLPLCSCGVLPAALGLRRDGASMGAVTSFLISTPQTGVDSIAVTWSILGWPVALAKVIAAFAAGLLGGTIADRVGSGSENQKSAPACTEIETGELPKRIWDYSFRGLFRDIYGWLAFGILVSALITTFLEPGQLSQFTILNGPLGLLAALAIGIPLYVCSVASVPIAAGLIYAGFPVGSALVFLMAGPATNAATMGAVRKTLGTKVFLVYILTVVLISLAAGGILNSLNVAVSEPYHAEHGMNSITGILSAAAGVLLIAGMIWFAFRDFHYLRMKSSVVSGNMDHTVKFDVDGMNCSNCETAVRDALNKLPGILGVTASAENSTVLLALDRDRKFNRVDTVRTITELGYNVRGE
ncbi:MAG: permease [Candidatus Fermentibacteria bacterium]